MWSQTTTTIDEIRSSNNRVQQKRTPDAAPLLHHRTYLVIVPAVGCLAFTGAHDYSIVFLLFFFFSKATDATTASVIMYSVFVCCVNSIVSATTASAVFVELDFVLILLAF